MKRFAAFLGLAALAVVMAVPARAGSANKFTRAELSIGGESAATIEIGDAVAFRLDVASSGSSHPKIYVVPSVAAAAFVTGDPLDVAAGGRFLTGIAGLGADGRAKRTGNDPKADSGIFTSTDLGIDFDRPGDYQVAVQVWDDEKMLAASNPVHVKVYDVKTVFMTYTANAAPNYYENAMPVAKTETAPAHYVVNAVVDGQAAQVRVVQDLTPTSSPFDLLYVPETGVFRAAFDENGYVVKFRSDPRVIEGYGVNPPDGNTIKLGLNSVHGMDKEYAFADGAEIWQRTGQYLYSFYGMNVWRSVPTVGSLSDLQKIAPNARWSTPYWMQLNEAGEIAALYLNPTALAFQSAAPTWLPDLKKFQVGTGPADEETGLAINYYFYEPERPGGGKRPLVIWFHGSQGGGFSWKPFFFGSDNIAKFATAPYQAKFAAGGAYVMVPRSNEDFGASHDRRLRWDDDYNGVEDAQLTPFYLALEDFLARHPDVDTDRIYVGGFSAGGGMTWLVARGCPDLFAAAFPAAAPERNLPDLDSKELGALSALPVWTVHANGDPVVPLTDKIRNVMAYLTTVNPRSRMTVMDAKAHSELTYVQNDMLDPKTGAPYLDEGGVAVPGTLIDWLNGQSAER